MADVDADALKDLVRRANFLPYLSYGSPHDLSILEKISGYYISILSILIYYNLSYYYLWTTICASLQLSTEGKAGGVQRP